MKIIFRVFYTGQVHFVSIRTIDNYDHVPSHTVINV